MKGPSEMDGTDSLNKKEMKQLQDRFALPVSSFKNRAELRVLALSKVHFMTVAYYLSPHLTTTK
jgi:hypothetical protein